jgi:hypothetical protein
MRLIQGLVIIVAHLQQGSWGGYRRDWVRAPGGRVGSGGEHVSEEVAVVGGAVDGGVCVVDGVALLAGDGDGDAVCGGEEGGVAVGGGVGHGSRVAGGSSRLLSSHPTTYAAVVNPVQS